MKAFQYDAEEVKRQDIAAYLAQIGSEHRGGRYRASWRGGDGFNIAIKEKDGVQLWHDFRDNNGGTIIDLYAIVNGLDAKADFAKIVNALGKFYGLAPKASDGNPRRIGKPKRQPLPVNWVKVARAAQLHTPDDATLNRKEKSLTRHLLAMCDGHDIEELDAALQDLIASYNRVNEIDAGKVAA